MMTISVAWLTGLILGEFLVCLGLGHWAGAKGWVSLAGVKSVSSRLADPLTLRLKSLLHRNFHQHMIRGRFLSLATVIFLNNLLLSAFITRVVYGLLFFLPGMLVGWGAFAKGVVASKKVSLLHPLLVLEFGAYIPAAAIGTDLGLQVVNFALGHTPEIYTLRPDIATAGLIVTVLLLAGALGEAWMLSSVAKTGLLTEEGIRQAKEDMARWLERRQ